jgi:hypothetical protein
MAAFFGYHQLYRDSADPVLPARVAVIHRRVAAQFLTKVTGTAPGAYSEAQR